MLGPKDRDDDGFVLEDGCDNEPCAIVVFAINSPAFVGLLPADTCSRTRTAADVGIGDGAGLVPFERVDRKNELALGDEREQPLFIVHASYSVRNLYTTLT